MLKKITVDVSEHSLNAIRYAAYTQTDVSWVHIGQPNENGKIELSFKLKNDNCPVNVLENFKGVLSDEKIREKSAIENVEATKLILSKVITSSSEADSCGTEDSTTVNALTKEQEEELDALIAEVEKELQAEVSNMKKDDDPQNITKTWEEMNKEEK